MITPDEIKPEGHPLMTRLIKRFPEANFTYFKPSDRLQRQSKITELYGKHWFLVIDGSLTKIILTEDFLEAYYLDEKREGYNDTAFEMMVQKINEYLS